MTTDTTEQSEAPSADAAGDHGDEAGAARRRQLGDRLLLPLFLPALSIGFVVLLAINISRLFLAGGKDVALAVIVVLLVSLVVGFAAVSAARNMRPVTTSILLGVVVMGLFGAGMLTFALGETGGEAAVKFGEVPEGYEGPITPLRVEALPSLKFDKANYDVPAGALDISYYDAGGQHTFVFSDPRYSWFELAVSAQGATDTGKVSVEAGTYEFYCSVPGHKAAGMVANLVAK